MTQSRTQSIDELLAIPSGEWHVGHIEQAKTIMREYKSVTTKAGKE